jgi:hypothetical protein
LKLKSPVINSERGSPTSRSTPAKPLPCNRRTEKTNRETHQACSFSRSTHTLFSIRQRQTIEYARSPASTMSRRERHHGRRWSRAERDVVRDR